MGQALSWTWSNPRLFLELLLVAALLVGGWLYRRQQRELEESKLQYGKLADNLNQQITIKDNQIQILKRMKDGKVQYQNVYLPPEGWFIIQKPKPEPNPDPGKPPDPNKPLPEDIIIIKYKGLCFRPGMGFEYGNKGLQAHLDAKVAFYKRYSLILGGTRYGLGPGITRHLDDWMWIKPANAELFMAYNVLRALDLAPVTIGIRSNF